jgi:hypothetical protein
MTSSDFTYKDWLVIWGGVIGTFVVIMLFVYGMVALHNYNHPPQAEQDWTALWHFNAYGSQRLGEYPSRGECQSVIDTTTISQGQFRCIPRRNETILEKQK